MNTPIDYFAFKDMVKIAKKNNTPGKDRDFFIEACKQFLGRVFSPSEQKCGSCQAKLFKDFDNFIAKKDKEIASANVIDPFIELAKEEVKEEIKEEKPKKSKKKLDGLQEK